MKIFGIPAILIISIFLAACGANEPQQTTTITPPAVNGETVAEDDYWARDNLDLGRVGVLLEKSDDPAEFESYLNADDGINNLDLNGDGYADYISVEEFDDRYNDERGLSLFTRFGPDIIQEVATIVFHRDDPYARGARVLVTGNPQIYGDDYYYEANWVDRALDIVSVLFTDDRDIYRSPYYYDNYPVGYDVYEIVDTPVYRTRIERLYPTTVFVHTDAPSFKNVKVKSKYKDKWMPNIHARLAKPTKEQADFRKKNPKRPDVARADRPGKNPQGDDRGRGNDKNNPSDNDDRGHRGGDDNPGKGGPPAGKGGPPADKGPDKSAGKGNPGKQKGKGGNKGGNGKGKKG